MASQLPIIQPNPTNTMLDFLHLGRINVTCNATFLGHTAQQSANSPNTNGLLQLVFDGARESQQLEVGA